MNKLESYKDLITYKKAYELTLEIYKLTRKFPKEETYGLVSQMKRAAVSIPSNISEGYRRRSRKEYVHFLSIAHGSCSELETQISLSHDLRFVTKKDYEKISSLESDVSKLLLRLIESLTQ